MFNHKNILEDINKIYTTNELEGAYNNTCIYLSELLKSEEFELLNKFLLMVASKRYFLDTPIILLNIYEVLKTSEVYNKRLLYKYIKYSLMYHYTAAETKEILNEI